MTERISKRARRDQTEMLFHKARRYDEQGKRVLFFTNEENDWVGCVAVRDMTIHLVTEPEDLTSHIHESDDVVIFDLSIESTPEMLLALRGKIVHGLELEPTEAVYSALLAEATENDFNRVELGDIKKRLPSELHLNSHQIGSIIRFLGFETRKVGGVMCVFTNKEQLLKFYGPMEQISDEEIAMPNMESILADMVDQPGWVYAWWTQMDETMQARIRAAFRLRVAAMLDAQETD